MEEESPALLTELSIQTLRLLSRSILLLSTVSNHPLLATLVAISLLVALYLPRALLPFLISPVPISTFLLLAALLRLGSPSPQSPAITTAAGDSSEDKVGEISSLCPESKTQTKVESRGRHKIVSFSDCYIDCGRRSGPLKVIYEDYEGEEEQECSSGGSQECLRWDADMGRGRIRPTGFAYADGDSENDVGSPPASGEEGGSSWLEELRFQWEDEEDMIEIELEEDEDDMIEIELEDNLIEIDISDGR